MDMEVPYIFMLEEDPILCFKNKNNNILNIN